jgi:hypothetical protein
MTLDITTLSVTKTFGITIKRFYTHHNIKLSAIIKVLNLVSVVQLSAVVLSVVAPRKGEGERSGHSNQSEPTLGSIL